MTARSGYGMIRSPVRRRRTLMALAVLMAAPWLDPRGTLASDADSGRYSQWELAALDREAAADRQEIEAETLLARAMEFRDSAYLYNEERAINMGQAGALELQAGALYGRAFGNLDKAGENWTKAVREYKKVQQIEKRDDAILRGELAVLRATQACRRAAEAYELAAEAYDLGNARQPATSATASEKAAEWRERLAVR